MRIFTFHSFKGGVGRSALMFHLGDYWASKGHVVALLDMDLHAPGISLHPWLEKPKPRNPYHKLGISDLLTTFYQTLDPESQTFQFFQPSRLLRPLKPPKGTNRWGTKGRMLVLPAGNVALPQSDPIDESFKVPIPSREAKANENPEQRAMRVFARMLREDLESFRLKDHPTQAGIDFLLIDCRTGHLAMEELAMGYLAERVVLVSGLNHQNLEGLALTLQKLRPERIRPLFYASELLVAFGPVPTHYSDDPQACHSLEKGMQILEQHRLPVQPGEREERLPPCFLLPYTPHLASSDEPVPQTPLFGRRHPYWEAVEQVADTLVPLESVQDAIWVTLLQTRNIAGAVLPPPPPPVPADLESPDPTARMGMVKGRGEMMQASGSIHERRDPTCGTLALMFQLPTWDWPFADDPAQVAAWLKQQGFPATLTDTQARLLDGLCASISLSVDEKEKILANWSDLSPFQIDSLVRVFQEENARFAALSSSLDLGMMSSLFRAQQEWAKFLRGEEMGEPVFLATLEVQPSPFAPWRHYATFWGEWATSLERQGRYVDAEERYRQALALEPTNGGVWNNLGILLKAHLHRPEEAEAAFRRVIQLDPNLDYLWNNLGNLLRDHLHRPEEAEAAFRRAIELDPTVAHHWNNLGLLLADHLHRPEEAEAAYRHAIELSPNWVYPWNNLGNLLKDHLHRPEEAEAAYRRAMELDPKDADSWNGLGHLLVAHLHRPEEAEAAYRRAIELDPTYAYPWNNLGLLLADHLHRPEEAEAAYRRAIELDPTYASPWNNLGNLLKNHLNRPEEAEAAFRRAKELEQQ
ncbi:MAG: tetratricopeptide repeat protein [Magnetococcales bacterium]|nr:tetratricopeptide repeat protein [Magnetococcales bacterium]